MISRMRNLYLFAFFLVIYEFTAYSANDMIMPGMIEVVKQFNAPISYVALSLSLYMLGECAIQLWLGPLAEKYGKRKAILYGNFSFLIFTLIIATSASIEQFMLGRWLQGSGMAFIAMGYALIHEKFNDKNAVRIIAIMGNVSILAPLIGPLIGGVIVSISNWHYVFVLSLILGSISLVGLYYYAPESNTNNNKMNLREILIHYREIAYSANFMQGVCSILFAAMPLLIWIGIAPNLILYNLKLSYSKFIIYQMIAIGGLSVSSLVIQFLAGKWELHQLIKRGCYISLSGIILSLIGSQSINIIAIGIFIYSFGLGLSNGSIIRIIMSNKNLSQSMTASLMTFIQTLAFALGIELSDFFCNKFNYSGFSFTFACTVFAIIATLITRKFAKANESRNWQ